MSHRGTGQVLEPTQKRGQELTPGTESGEKGDRCSLEQIQQAARGGERSAPPPSSLLLTLCQLWTLLDHIFSRFNLLTQSNLSLMKQFESAWEGGRTALLGLGTEKKGFGGNGTANCFSQAKLHVSRRE